MKLASCALGITLMAMMLASCSFNTSMFSNNDNGGIGSFRSDPNAKIVTRTMKMKAGLKDLTSHAGIKVVYTGEGNNTVVISAPDDLIDKVRVEADGDDLDIGYKQSVSNVRDRVTVTVNISGMSEFDAHSGSSIALPAGYTPAGGELSLETHSGSAISGSGLKASVIGLSASSGSSISVGITAGSAVIEASSGSSISVSGTAENAGFKASSGASINAKALDVATGEISASSGGAVNSSVREVSGMTKSSGGSVSNNSKR